ncbi:MAG: AmmeMemoRadiSam system radical SAM enzyme [Candidatus Heimdallarchaeota archaeon]|nr:AmmeMemoRadiSam system radical SAM enzyme [Candidatus Heimdallarchaeota archaeon]
MNNLEIELKNMSVEGKLFRAIPDKPDRIECYACAHYCSIKDGKAGICKVRYNENGVLKVPHGYVSAINGDPVEKKPYYHFFPKTLAMSFGMLGCDFRCGYCQNYDISQTLRDPSVQRGFRKISAQDIVNYALEYGCRSVVSTYNEPLITSEWAIEVFKEAKKNNLATGYVSNGNSTPEVLDYIRPYTDAYKIDLKSFNKKQYQTLGGNLEKILKSIENVYQKGFWLEIVTLLIPGFNNSPDEIEQMADFIAGISVDIPWHITAFHKDYKMRDKDNTTPENLLEAAEIGVKAGINYIYPGNVHGRVGDWENTNCPNCKTVLVERIGFRVISYNLNDEGRCPTCDDVIPGRWETPKERKSLFRFLT